MSAEICVAPISEKVRQPRVRALFGKQIQLCLSHGLHKAGYGAHIDVVDTPSSGRHQLYSICDILRTLTLAASTISGSSVGVLLACLKTSRALAVAESLKCANFSFFRAISEAFTRLPKYIIIHDFMHFVGQMA